MPGIRHQAAVQLIRDNPRIAAFLLVSTGIAIPVGTATAGDSDLSLPEMDLDLPRSGAVESRADVVTVIGGSGDGKVRHVVITEPQSTRPSIRKWWTWLVYVGLAGRRYLRPVTLLVLALNDMTAKDNWKALRTGHPDLVLKPVWITRFNTPDPDAPGAGPFGPQLALLGVLNKKYNLSNAKERRYVLDVIAHAPMPVRADYARIIARLATPDERKQLEEDLRMTKFRWPFLDDQLDAARAQAEAEGMAKGEALGEARGEARGEADMLLTILEARFPGTSVTETVRAKVRECGSIEILKSWARRAIDAQTLEDVFALPS